MVTPDLTSDLVKYGHLVHRDTEGRDDGSGWWDDEGPRGPARDQW